MNNEIFNKIKKHYTQFDVDWQYRRTPNRETTCSYDEFWIRRRDDYFVIGMYVNLKSRYVSIRYANDYREDINFKSDDELLELLHEQINRVLIVCVVTDKYDLIHLFKYKSSETDLQADLKKYNAELSDQGYIVRANEFYSMYEHTPIVYDYELWEDSILKFGNGLIDKVKERYKDYVTEYYDEWEYSSHHHNSEMPITQINWFSSISRGLILNVSNQEIYANFGVGHTYIGNLWGSANVTIAYPTGEDYFAFDENSLSNLFALLDKLVFTAFMQTAETIEKIFWETLRNKNELVSEYNENSIILCDDYRKPIYRFVVDIVELKAYSKLKMKGENDLYVETTSYKTTEEMIEDIRNQMRKVYIVCHYLNGNNQIVEKFLSDFDCYEAEIANISNKKIADGIEKFSFEIFSLLAPKEIVNRFD